MELPRFYAWDGGATLPTPWSFGWYLPEIDLVCVHPGPLSDWDGEKALSPVCCNRAVAFFAFVLKAVLLRIDDNLRR